jgi:hypothetical protein
MCQRELVTNYGAPKKPACCIIISDLVVIMDDNGTYGAVLAGITVRPSHHVPIAVPCMEVVAWLTRQAFGLRSGRSR